MNAVSVSQTALNFMSLSERKSDAPQETFSENSEAIEVYQIGLRPTRLKQGGRTLSQALQTQSRDPQAKKSASEEFCSE